MKRCDLLYVPIKDLPIFAIIKLVCVYTFQVKQQDPVLTLSCA